MASAHQLKDLLVVPGAVEANVGQSQALKILLVSRRVWMIGMRSRVDHLGRDNVNLQTKSFGKGLPGQSQGDDPTLPGKVVPDEDEMDRLPAHERRGVGALSWVAGCNT